MKFRTSYVVLAFLITMSVRAGGHFPPFFNLTDMVFTYEGSAYQLPKLEVRVSREEVVVSRNGVAVARLKSRDDLQFVMLKPPDVRGVYESGNTGVSIFLETHEPAKGVYIYLLNEEAWAFEMAKPSFWTDLLTDQRHATAPPLISGLLKSQIGDSTGRSGDPFESQDLKKESKDKNEK